MWCGNDKANLVELQLVAVFEFNLVHFFSIDPGAIHRTQIADDQLVTLGFQFRVLALQARFKNGNITVEGPANFDALNHRNHLTFFRTGVCDE